MNSEFYASAILLSLLFGFFSGLAFCFIETVHLYKNSTNQEDFQINFFGKKFKRNLCIMTLMVFLLSLPINSFTDVPFFSGILIGIISFRKFF